MSDCQGATVTLARGVDVQEMVFSAIQDFQDAAVMVIRGVEVPGRMFWHSSGFSNGCLPTGHFHQ
eukprot:7482145-Pyramimonas_sp.AAC.1